ncbi:MAG: hypothetical protein HZA50_05565 [Planctomycetes bacterium]|nr:hypothetical protein [Planctomycetota bacterium]
MDKPRTAKGRDDPFAVQFSVFLAARSAQFKDVLDLLAEQELEVLGFDMEDHADLALMRIILNNPAKARAAFKQDSVAFTENVVVLVELTEEVTIAQVILHLMLTELTINRVFMLSVRHNNNPILVVHVDSPSLATQALLRNGMSVLGHEDFLDAD